MGECGAGIGRGGDCQLVDTEPELPNLVGVVGVEGGRQKRADGGRHVGFHVGIDVTWSQI